MIGPIRCDCFVHGGNVSDFTHTRQVDGQIFEV